MMIFFLSCHQFLSLPLVHIFFLESNVHTHTLFAILLSQHILFTLYR